MIRIFLLAAVLVSFIYSDAQVNVIPKPKRIETHEGSFKLKTHTPLYIKCEPEDKVRLYEYASRAIPVKVANKKRKGGISLEIVDSAEDIASPEGYVMKVGEDGVNILALAPEGLFHGLTTFLTLAEADPELQAMTIVDEPRFSYRGMMLDISRHFRDKDFIKKQIDAMVKLKLNNLHLHLTDAAGWRLEIKRYPELTEKAAWRKGETWKEWNSTGHEYRHEGDPDAVGGYLTQEDAREIVAYAAERYINVIPEIEMPSHSEEVTAAFPELSCGHLVAGQPDFCVGNEKTFEFLQNVIDEVIEIFPSKIIHIGGDEASKEAWKECDLCKKRMEENSLEGIDELQSYLVKRIETYLNSKGRDLLGWDEIMEGGLAPNAAVMSWRGIDAGVKAAKGGHRAIMAPGAYCYLDGYQDAPQSQPEAIGGYLPLNKVYSYNPVPDSVSNEISGNIIGLQGNLWCEYIPTAEHAEYMLYPRMFAISEIGWTPQAERNYEDFLPRVKALTADFRKMGYNLFDIEKEIGNKPEASRPEEHLARNKKVTYNIPWWRNYPAGGVSTLVDGLRGGWNYNDGLWQGFLSRGDNRMDVTVDLEEVTPITYVGAEFMQLIGPGVWFPSLVEIQVSDNGTDFTTLAVINHEQTPSEGVSFKEYSWRGNASARYVRYIAKAEEGCQFADELIVR